MGDAVEQYTTFAFSMDAKTARLLEALRDDEHINLSAWVRDAIRRKAGLTSDKPKPDDEG